MKLIIECTEQTYSECKKISGLSETAFVIANGKPYDDSGDLISRSEIRKAIEELPNANPSYSHTCDVVEREDVLDKIDNAQVAEGPKYKWEFKKGNGYAKCPVCGHLTTCWSEEELKDYRYCYYCGTKLEKGDVE